MDLETAINRIKYYAFAEMGWTKNKLAKAAKVPFNVVAKIHDEDWNPKLEQLKRLENIVPKGFSLARLISEIQPSQTERTTNAKNDR